MANPDAPFGLIPVRHRSGGRITAKKYYLASGEGNALFIGDAVVLAGSSDTDGVCPTVTKATAGNGNYITGVIVGFEPDATYTTMHRAASTARYVYVVDDPNVVFHIRDDGAAALTAANVGQNANLIMTHSGSTATGLSKMELDTNSDPPDADASNQLLILGKADFPTNELGANAVWEVMINLHTYRSTGDGDGSLGV